MVLEWTYVTWRARTGARLVVDAVVEARHGGEDGGPQLGDVVEQLQDVAAVEADADTAANGGRQRVALVDVGQRQVRDVPVT